MRATGEIKLVQVILGKLLRMAAGLALILPSFGCAPARMLNAVVSKDGYQIERGIVYDQEHQQKLDLYLPDEPVPSKKVVIFFYGGRWEFGSRNDYLFVGQALASRGVMTVLADYRLYPEVKYPAFLEDGAKAVRWVRDHIADYGGDSGQIYLMGHSAGAYNAAMLAVDPSLLADQGMAPRDLAGVIGLAGPYDFLPIKDPVIKEIFAADDLTETQPVTYANKEAPPLFLLTGEDDVTVLPRNSQSLADAVNAAGGEATVKIYDRIGHPGVVLSLASPLRWLAPVLNDIMDFLERPKTAKRRAA